MRAAGTLTEIWLSSLEGTACVLLGGLGSGGLGSGIGCTGSGTLRALSALGWRARSRAIECVLQFGIGKRQDHEAPPERTEAARNAGSPDATNFSHFCTARVIAANSASSSIPLPHMAMERPKSTKAALAPGGLA